MKMKKFRIYALIYGENLPVGKIGECEIKKMSFDEQEERSFKPIQSTFSDSDIVQHHKTYVTFLPYIDPIRIKSEYVITCDIEEDRANDALGGAIRVIDRISRILTLSCLEDIKRTFKKDIGHFEPYIYQVNKIYELDENGSESEVDFKLESVFVYLPDRPEFTAWRTETTQEFLEELLDSHDEVLERSLKYLYRSSVGVFLLHSKEKIALDHFKSIEIIVNSLSSKQHFKQRLVDAAKLIDISPEEVTQIQSFWDDRSMHGDIAHPSLFDQAEWYPNQFPLPSNVRYSGGMFETIAPKILLKYFRYKRRQYLIDIDEPSEYTDKDGKRTTTEDTMGTIYTQDGGSHLYYHTKEKNKKELIKKIKASFSKMHNKPEADIESAILQPGKKSLIIMVTQ